MILEKPSNYFVAIVEDEEDIFELVSLHLKREGFRTEGFKTGTEFLKSLESRIPSLVILDLLLPDINGLEICKILKKDDRTSSIPIIILTAKSNETDIVLGLELGADDYIVKPFSPREFVARVRALLRRIHLESPSTKGINIKNGFLVINPEKQEVRVENRVVDLTATEFKILKTLAEKKGWVFSRDKLLDIVWGDDKFVIDRTVDVHISHLRRKLGKAGKLIKNIKGTGYKLEEA